MTAPGSTELRGPIRRVGVVLRRRSPEVPPAVEHLRSLCTTRGIELAFEEGNPNSPSDQPTLDPSGEGLDLLLALGGDGTMLRAARLGMRGGIPVFGVNLGRLGFLTATPAKDLEENLDVVLEGKAVLDHRFTLEATVVGPSQEMGPYAALNDIVVHTAGAARITPLDLSVGGAGGEKIGSFSADGVIFATPTGSTAYSMSAGGPIIAPDVECIVVTAICPHSLAVRPLLVPADAELFVRAMKADSELQLTVDGKVERALAPEVGVKVRKGAHSVALVRLPGQTFFRTMRKKLNWAANPPERA